MSVPDKILEFAIEQGYDGALPLAPWRGYDVYEPVFTDVNEDGYVCVGLPLIILAKGDEIRMSTPDECFAHLHETRSEPYMED